MYCIFLTNDVKRNRNRRRKYLGEKRVKLTIVGGLYRNITMVNKVQVPRNVNNHGGYGEAGQECEFLIRMCRFPRLTSSVTRWGYSLDRVYVAFMGINTCLRFFSWFGARHHPIGSNTFTSDTVFNQTWMTIKALSKC